MLVRHCVHSDTAIRERTAAVDLPSHLVDVAHCDLVQNEITEPDCADSVAAAIQATAARDSAAMIR